MKTDVYVVQVPYRSREGRGWVDKWQDVQSFAAPVELWAARQLLKKQKQGSRIVRVTSAIIEEWGEA